MAAAAPAAGAPYVGDSQDSYEDDGPARKKARLDNTGLAIEKFSTVMSRERFLAVPTFTDEYMQTQRHSRQMPWSKSFVRPREGHRQWAHSVVRMTDEDGDCYLVMHVASVILSRNPLETHKQREHHVHALQNGLKSMVHQVDDYLVTTHNVVLQSRRGLVGCEWILKKTTDLSFPNDGAVALNSVFLDPYGQNSTINHGLALEGPHSENLRDALSNRTVFSPYRVRVDSAHGPLTQKVNRLVHLVPPNATGKALLPPDDDLRKLNPIRPPGASQEDSAGSAAMQDSQGSIN